MKRLLAWLALLLATAHAVAVAQSPPPGRRSSYEDMRPETRAMQDDDILNPGSLWLLDGAALWTAPAGPQGRTCASCHGEAERSMRGVAARYPAFNDKRGRAVTLEDRIVECRTTRQSAPPFQRESKDLLALTAHVARQSRGAAIESSDARLSETIEAGRTLFQRRMGQINLSCAQCHDDNAGQKLAGITIPQGHPTGYPLYRLEWQTLGSLHRRLRNCMIGMRAEPFPAGSDELIALETFLMWRARGLPIETPAVRP